MRIEPGTRLGPHEIQQQIGSGGMGVVYRARDTKLRRDVAIKVLPDLGDRDPERFARFTREARALASLNHPNITTVHDICEQDGLHYIVMELVPGRTLAEAIGGGLPLKEAIRIAIQIADALGRAHGAGIVHRDIKPANVMLTPEGLAKVLDFGLAKPAGPADLEAQGATATGFDTIEGRIVGTVSYMSPEQARGQPVDPRSDIFSFGAVLYEMVSGRRPFDSAASDPVGILGAILHTDPPPLPDQAPQELQALIARCLRKDPERRPQSMKDVRIALDDVREDSEPGRQAARPARPPRAATRWRLAVLTVALLALAGAAAVLLSRDTGPMPAPVPLTTYAGFEREPTFSPDGGQIAFVWDGERQDNRDIYVQVIGSGRPLRLTTDPAADFSPAWSPDGRWIAFLRKLPDNRAAILLVPALGGTERRLAEVLEPSWWMAGPHVAWTPDSRWVAFSDQAEKTTAHGLYLLSVETGERRVLTVPPTGTLSDGDPAFAADGRSLAFSRALGGSDVFVLRLTAAQAPAGEPKRVTSASVWATSPTWLETGRWPLARRDLVFSSWGRLGLWRVAASGGEPARLAYGSEEASRPAYSASRRRLAYTRSTSVTVLARVDIATGTITQLVGSSRQDWNPDVAPGGQRVVFQSTRTGPYEVWTSNVDGSDAVQVTTMNAPMTGGPTWAPDGSSVVFDSNKVGQFDVYVAGVHGGRPRRMTEHEGNDLAGVFSRDGRWIYFASNRTGDWQIWKMPSAGGEAKQITTGGGFISRESFDGRFLYYLHGPAAATALRRVPVDGGEEVTVIPTLLQRAFALTHDGIYFFDEEKSGVLSTAVHTDVASAAAMLSYLDLRTGAVKRIAPVGKAAFGLTLTPDGRAVLYSRVLQEGSDLMLVENFR